MPCYYPIAAVQAAPGAKLKLFKREEKHLYRNMPGKHLEVPCGQCSGCRRRRSLEWAMRCMHEAQTHRYNTYLTLTYDEKNVPQDYSLRHRDYVLFMKALRNRLTRETENYRNGIIDAESTLLHASHDHVSDRSLEALTKLQRQQNCFDLNSTNSKISKTILPAKRSKRQISFYMCGEYGDQFGRPHYHSLIFGLDFSDKIYLKKSKAGEKIYTSPTLQKLWKHGYSSIGNVTFNSAAYISRYVLKKRTGDGNRQNYEILDLDTGEIAIKKKEYNCMSRNPGIGKNWFTQFKEDVYVQDKVITKSGMSLKPPRYYDRELKKLDAARLESIKHARELEALAREQDHSSERLAVQEIVANAKAQNQTRNLE